jgi:hypothetical protein
MKYYTQNTRNRRRENLAKLQAKNLPNLFWLRNPPNCPRSSVEHSSPGFKTQRTPNSIVFSFWLGKGLFSQDFTRFWDNKLQFWPEHLHTSKKQGKISNKWKTACILHMLKRYQKIMIRYLLNSLIWILRQSQYLPWHVVQGCWPFRFTPETTNNRYIHPCNKKFNLPVRGGNQPYIQIPVTNSVHNLDAYL